MEQLTLHQRTSACLVLAVLGLFVAGVPYQLFWEKRQNQILYEFYSRRQEALVPVPCKHPRGQSGVDYVEAWAPSIFGHRKGEPSHIEACWYPVSRFVVLYEIPNRAQVAGIIRQSSLTMNLRELDLKPSSPSRWLLMGIPLGLLLAFVGIAQWFIRRPHDLVAASPQANSGERVDTAQLQADLARLRENLGG